MDVPLGASSSPPTTVPDHAGRETSSRDLPPTLVTLRRSSTIRRIALPAVFGALALATVITLAPLGAVEANRGSLPAVASSPGGHPDSMGVSPPRPLNGALLLLTPLGGALLAVGALVLAASAVGAEGRTGTGARLRRWRAQLEGAPPVAS